MEGICIGVWRGYKLLCATRAEIVDFIEKHHYSHSINGCKVTSCYKLLDASGTLCGAVLFGGLSTTAWKKFSASEIDVIELRRLVLLDSVPRNGESWVIARCLRHLRKTTQVSLVVSYADPYHQHVGVIYQASNWIYVGSSPPDTLLKTPQGRLYHSRALRTKYKGKYKPFVLRLRELQERGELELVTIPGKHCYVYELRSNIRHKPLNKQPYPKGDKS